MTGIKKENRGGVRPNAGRKKKTLTESQVDSMVRTARKWERKLGKKIDDVLLELIYGEDQDGKKIDVTGATRVKAIQIYKDHTMAKIKEGGDTDKNVGPGLFLPEQRPDPANNVVPINKDA